MPRTARSLVAGGHYHFINRGNDRAVVFHETRDYEAFVRLMVQAQARIGLSLLAYCVMPNHFHVVAAQRDRRDISRWVHWLLTTHSHHHHLKRGSSGRVWQGRFKAFAIERDEHLLTVMRYVERNALRAGFVTRAEDWPWSSIACREGHGPAGLLAAPPLPLPSDWLARVNAPQTAAELAALRACVHRQRPFRGECPADDGAANATAAGPVRRRGRPRKTSTAAAAPG